MRKTVNPVLSGHSKLDKTKVFMANGSLMKVESIGECSPLEKKSADSKIACKITLLDTLEID